MKKNQKYEMTWSDVLGQCSIYGGILRHLGIEKEQPILIFSDTCREWGFLDMAILASGGITVPVYHSSHPDDIEHILTHSEGQILFVQNLKLYQKLKKTQGVSQLKHIIMIDPDAPPSKDYLSLNELSTQCGAVNLEASAKNLNLKDPATIIYTSGTSGTPKGILLTHQQIMSCVSEVYPIQGITSQDRSLTFLPFSHVLGRQELWGHYFTGFTLGYAESIEKIKQNLEQVRPTVFVGVPRIFEKIFYGIQAQVQISPLKRTVFKKALEIGKRVQSYRMDKKSPPFPLLFQYQLVQKNHSLADSKENGWTTAFCCFRRRPSGASD